MKRLIFIVALMLVVIGVGIFESVYVTDYFNDLHTKLIAINESLIKEGENGDFEDAEKKTSDLIDHWNDSKMALHTLCNHSILRAFEDKLTSMRAWIECDGYGDSRAFCEEAIRLSSELANEAHPYLGNIM